LQEPFFGAIDSHRPQVAEDAFIAPATVVVGRIRIGALSSVWYGSVLRGDDQEIIIAENSNVQDLSVMHADPGYPAVLGDRVTVGHRAIVHGARVEDDVLIGRGAILLNGAKVDSGPVIAAGAVVTPGAKIPPASVVAGIPVKILRPVRESDTAMVGHACESYVGKSVVHREVEPLSLREVLPR
jgi:carbonic anhydrase/acetyltransferase-like protein (isoleucine patch superfamily)